MKVDIRPKPIHLILNKHYANPNNPKFVLLGTNIIKNNLSETNFGLLETRHVSNSLFMMFQKNSLFVIDYMFVMSSDIIYATQNTFGWYIKCS